MLAIQAPQMQGFLFGQPEVLVRKMATPAKQAKPECHSGENQGDMFMDLLNEAIGVNPLAAVIDKSVLKACERHAKKAVKRWTDAEILGESSLEDFISSLMPKSIEMHEWVLKESLNILKEEDKALEKLEVLEWIYAPDFIERLGVNAQGKACIVRRHVNDIPFSFANCCRLLGIDKDELREMLLAMVTEKLRNLLLAYVKHLTGMTQVPVLHRSKIRTTHVYRLISQIPSKTFGIHRLVKAASFTKGNEDEASAV